ncbi:carbohydrate-binding domain-containing protein [Anaerotalea alkaliphila]|uniref:Carbohydrate-binding domain-containing protein n=1 Tax=Anaerotalea alkaliphila TaxID=2662126 RepID=A0A7X5HUZ9_9FIRM|nr:carbohydrate-binding domain-containing protein [Anaerotalea alkaliphila]NDL67135.1 carbohydrate-binding domain-containing protein [Anaerotalea alkaliphila]
MKPYKKRFLGLAMALLLLGGCAQGQEAATPQQEVAAAYASGASVIKAAANLEAQVGYSLEDLESGWSPEAATSIAGTGTSWEVEGSGVELRDSQAVIVAGGTYVVSGVMEDGMLLVDAEDAATVRIVLNGAELKSASDAPIYVKNAEKAILTLEEGTLNRVEDGTTRPEETEEMETAGGAIFSNDDLTINGTGSLTVQGNYKHGVEGDDAVLVTGADLEITAVKDGINVNDLFALKEGSLAITAGDDGIHSDGALVVDGGVLAVEESQEGLEGALVVVNAGDIRVRSADDGINTALDAEETDPSATAGLTTAAGRPRMDANDGSRLEIRGGTLVVDAQGDGIDANGDILMTGGSVTVNGPAMDANGAIDYNGSFTMEGGVLVAAGSAGMVQAPSEASTQNSLLFYLGTQKEGATVEVLDEAGNVLAGMETVRESGSLVVSTPEIVQGGTYRVLVDGQETASLVAAGTVSTYGQGGMGGGRGGMGGQWVRPEEAKPGPGKQEQ